VVVVGAVKGAEGIGVWEGGGCGGGDQGGGEEGQIWGCHCLGGDDDGW